MATSKTAVALIQGASRGIGLEFCQHILRKHPQVQVLATCRNPDHATDLKKLQETHKHLDIQKLDVRQEKEISEVADYTKTAYGRLDLLINSAGILYPSGRGETSLRDVDAQGLLTTLETNTVGPLLMAKYFSPILKLGEGYFQRSSDSEKIPARSTIVNMSAKVGSITDNGLGGWYSYRMSKSALNMCTKNLSIELGRGQKTIICISLHPGTVDTELSRPYHRNVKNLFTTEHSVNLMMNVISKLTMADTGKFYTYSGEILPF